MNPNKTDQLIKKLTKITAIVLAIVLVIVVILSFSFVYFSSPVDRNDKTKIAFKIESGWGKSKIAEELKEEDLIRNSDILKLYLKFIDRDSILKAGTYNLSKSYSMEEIVDIISSNESLENEEVTLTLIEGKKLSDYVSIISKSFPYSEDEIYAVISSKAYLNTLIEKYWFIDNSVLNDKLYYPLEGYIFADTYRIRKTASIEDIFTVLLDGMDNKLSTYKNEIEASKKSVHSLLTLASVVELEAVSAEDRLLVAGVFENRMKSNIPLGSDVTTYYGCKKELTETLTISQINECNAYNTRGTCAIIGLPVGPICSPSYSSITAALKPQQTNYNYFVADVNNKLYFAETNEGHIQNIASLRSKGLWPE